MRLTEENVERIHQATLEVLTRTGVSVEDPAALEVFASRNVPVDGSRVYISEELVERAVASAPSKFTLRGRRPARDLTFGEGDTVFGSASGCPHVIDANGFMRSGTMEDLEAAVKLGHVLGNIDMLGYPVEPADVLPEERAKRTLCAVLSLTDKASELPLATREDLDASCGAMEILYGADWHEEPRIFSVLNPLSPLRLTHETAYAAVRLAELGQVVCVTPAAMAGFSSPATRAGTLVIQNAEVLASLVLVQLVREGAPFIYGGTSSIASMRTGDFLVGVPEYWTLMVATTQMADRYGLPCRAGGALTDSNMLDVQSGLESAMGLATVLDSNVDFILDAAGALSSFAAFSYEKFMVDDEFLGMMRTMNHPIPVDEEALALEVIEKVGIGGSYLTEDHTLAHCRDYDKPSFFNRRSYEAWAKHTGKDLTFTALQRYDQKLEEYEPPDIDRLTRDQLVDFCLDRNAGDCSRGS